MKKYGRDSDMVSKPMTKEALDKIVPPLKNPEGPRAGAYADDDPELHERYRRGEFDGDLNGDSNED